MITVGDKKWSKLDAGERIAHVRDGLLGPATDEHTRKQFEWYINKKFIDGEQYLRYNERARSIETPPLRRNQVRLVINKTKASMRSVENYITRSKPRPEVLPGDTDEDTIINARRAGKLLEYLHDHLDLRSKIKQLIHYSLYTSVGFWTIGWDDSASHGEGQVSVYNEDPYDIVLPMIAFNVGPIIHSPFIGKVVARPTDAIKYDERYDKKARMNVKSDGEIAYARMKSRDRRGAGQKSDRHAGQQTTLVHEVEIMDYEEGRIKRFTFAGDVILKDEDLDRDFYDMYLYQPEANSTIFNTPWVSHLIPPNKALNRAQSLILDYVNKSNQFRLIAEKGHNINLAATGRADPDAVEIIEHNPGRSVEQFRPSPLPLTIHRLSDDSSTYIDTLGGSHEASYGSMPSGARSGKLLEALQAADANNLSGMRESLEVFLSVVYGRMLDIASENYVATRTVKITDREGQRDPFQVIGGSNEGARPEGAVIINKDNEVRVSVGSMLGYSKEAQRETLAKLVELGVLPAEEILRQYEFPNIDELSEKAREQRLEEGEMKADIAGHRGNGQQQQAQPQQQAQQGGDMVDLADQENAQMMNGVNVPPTPNATPEHSQAHINFIKSALAKGNPQGQQMIAEHVRAEVQGGV